MRSRYPAPSGITEAVTLGTPALMAAAISASVAPAGMATVTLVAESGRVAVPSTKRNVVAADLKPALTTSDS